MLPSFDPYRTHRYPVAEAARLAEDTGFGCGWVGDHLAYVPPTLDPFVALAHAAGATERLALGFSVLLLPMRPVIWVAKQLISLCTLAPDRVMFGVGVGGEGPAEWEAAGVPLNERGRRMDEALGLLPALLRGEAVDHPGPLLPLRTPALDPALTEPPPLIVGGRSEIAVRRAARVADAWMPAWLEPARVAQRAAILHEAAEAAGRPRPGVVTMVFTNVNEDRDRAIAEADGLYRGQYNLDWDTLGRWAAIGPPEAVAEDLARYDEAGSDGFVFVVASPDHLGQIERLAEVKAILEKG
jgi:alkanesulfonate monooxygenase SsuD/methylene tetrahydromethanopterin reductase-like flavin-dependent oxidoreductase (luciferase family)